MPIYKVNKLVTFDGIVTQVDVDVSGDTPDAQTTIWQFKDLDGSIIAGVVKATSETTVQINISPAPVAGDYRLVGLA